MEFALLYYIDDSRFEGITGEDERKLQEDCRAEDTALETSGRLVVARALKTPDTARTVTIRASKTMHTDGPFAETKEYLGGIVIVRAANIEEAVAIAESSALARYAKVEDRPAYDIRA